MSVKPNKSEKAIEKITLHFDDGSERTVNKGFICGFVQDEIEGTVQSNMHFVNVSGEEIQTVVLLMLELGVKMGMFDGLEGAEDEQS